MRKRLVKFIGFKDYCKVIVSPNKNNIRFNIIKADSTLKCLNWLVEMMKEKNEQMPFTLIFCQVVNDIVFILSYLLMELGSSGLYAKGHLPQQQSCLIGVYYSQTPQSLKDTLTASFENDTGCTRVAIASSSLSMGVDFPNVKYVIHFGPSKTLTGQLQEAGRAGRDGSEAFNIIMYLPKHLKNCEKQVKQFIHTGEKTCVRQALLYSFDNNILPNEPLHACCNICHMQCKCQGDECDVPLYRFDEPISHQEDMQMVSIRFVSEDDKECLKSALDELHVTLASQSSTAVLNCSNSYLFGLDANTIQTIVDNASDIFGIADLRRYCPYLSVKLLIMILEVMREMFDDIEIPDDLYQISLETEPFINKLLETIDQTQTDDDVLRESFLDETFHLSDEWL
jgi:superfamily II DNA helicase RecQ